MDSNQDQSFAQYPHILILPTPLHFFQDTFLSMDSKNI